MEEHNEMENVDISSNLERMNDLLDFIRLNRGALYGFFSMMPKGV